MVNKSRVVVERCRWRCILKTLEESTEKVLHTVIACCILNNICTLRGDELEEYTGTVADEENVDFGQFALGQGNRVRQALANYLARD